MSPEALPLPSDPRLLTLPSWPWGTETSVHTQGPPFLPLQLISPQHPHPFPPCSAFSLSFPSWSFVMSVSPLTPKYTLSIFSSSIVRQQKPRAILRALCRSSYLISEQFCVRGTMISPFYRWRDRGTGQVKGSSQVPQIPGIHPGSLAPEKGVDPPPCSFGAA